MSKVIRKTEENQLLQSRESGLRDVREMYAMKAHGKNAGMDVFSWVNPNVGALAAVLKSMPFKVIWLATRSQVEALLNEYSGGLDNVESLVIYDSAILAPDFNWLVTRTSVAGVKNIEDAMELLTAMKQRERVFLYSLPINNWTTIKESIELRLKTWN